MLPGVFVDDIFRPTVLDLGALPQLDVNVAQTSEFKYYFDFWFPGMNPLQAGDDFTGIAGPTELDGDGIALNGDHARANFVPPAELELAGWAGMTEREREDQVFIAGLDYNAGYSDPDSEDYIASPTARAGNHPGRAWF